MTFQNNGWIKVRKFEDICDGTNTMYCVKPLEIVLGKSESCLMTAMLGAYDKPVFDATAFLLKISEENDKNRYLYVGGDMVCSLLTNDTLYKNISNTGNNLTPYIIAIGEENIYFLTPNFKFIKRENIENFEILETNETFVYLFHYGDSKCRNDSFEKLGT